MKNCQGLFMTMKYTELKIQTQREAPNNARTEGFAFLVRAGYLTRENELLPLGELAHEKLRNLPKESMMAFFSSIELPVLQGDFGRMFYLTESGKNSILKCKTCEYADLAETASAQNFRIQTGAPLPIEKVHTPECNTIESLTKFLHVKEDKTAKALMFIRISDGKFIFIVMRGDTQLNLNKLKKQIGEVRPATSEEITSIGAVPGYASAIGIENARIIADELIPQSINLVAGANEDGYHLLNTNYGRDYSTDLILKIVQAQDGDRCTRCKEGCICLYKAELLVDHTGIFDFNNILLALAETYHDEKGLTFPKSAAPFDVYLMHIAGKTINTFEKADEIYNALQNEGISVLFDDRDERAGVKFNDADLIGCPVRITVGEKNLKEGKIEIKARTDKANQLVPIEDAIPFIKASILAPNLGSM